MSGTNEDSDNPTAGGGGAPPPTIITTTTTSSTAAGSSTEPAQQDEDKTTVNAGTLGSFHHALHVQYIVTLPAKLNSPDSYEGAVTEHLRMSGIYWTVAALSILESSEQSVNAQLKLREEIVPFVFACWDATRGGFGGNVGHEAHILYTLSAVQILAMADCLDHPSLDKRAVGRFVQSLQQDDGSFCGDEWGEVDTRFSYCALATWAILGLLPTPEDEAFAEATREEEAEVPRLSWRDVRRAAQYVARCQNFDGGFGCIPGAESHAGQVFCCVGALAIAQSLDLLRHPQADILAWWLAERQCDSGGLNGRPEKQADVCYSWWILSSLSILGSMDWIDASQLQQFILQAQDEDDGGIADRPHDMPDVFHTFFGLAGLSLLGFLHRDGKPYRKIDPLYAMPTNVVQRCGLPGQVMAPRRRRRQHQGKSEHSTVGDEEMKEDNDNNLAGEKQEEEEEDDRLDRYEKLEY